MNSTYEFTLKEEPKVKMEIFLGTILANYTDLLMSIEDFVL